MNSNPNILRTLISYGLFPVVAFGGVTAAYFLLQSGIRPEFVVAMVAVPCALLIIFSEWYHPFFTKWQRNHRDFGTDVAHVTISMIALPYLFETAFTVLLVSGAIQVTAWLGFAIWPDHWPILAQVFLALLIGEFGAYWKHRLFHTVPLLWRFHAIHHSSERLYWLNAGRMHPVDTLAAFLVANAPLMLLGCNPEVLALHSLFVSVHGMLQHCNVQLRLGPLNWIFSTADLHRWHHSRVLDEANSNYGSNFILWDIVFGTRFLPKRIPPENIGLSDMDDFPTGYLEQLSKPFRWRKP